ncbi:MAG: exonuclease SbcCD subunit D C-terminal domain-containing protein [Syntrophomonadaceae bacterium]|nr:exonuclease SbcCD subunit D C-terminal domain-containing protein [Syntrophomonadaceae bacterium]
MKILHTSDWHLGRSLYGRKRYEEFAAFLDWLAKLLEQEHIDVLLVAGDIFDTATPSNRAQELYYQFLCRAAESSCRHVVITAGNHDSPSFLNAPRELLRHLQVYTVGSIGESPEEEVLLLKDSHGRAELIVCAVPYLRDRDIRSVEAGETPEDKERKLIEGIRGYYALAAEQAQEMLNRLEKPVPVVAMGHLFAAGGSTVEGDGVRDLYVGTLAHVGADIFPAEFDYVALGHLHTAQLVAGQERIRYSGTPLPMSFGEAARDKQVITINFNEDCMDISPVAVPLFQALRSVRGDWEQIEQQIVMLKSEARSIWLEIIYQGGEIISDLREKLDELVADTGLEILRVKNNRLWEQEKSLAGEGEVLSELDVAEVFELCLQAYEVEAEQREDLLDLYNEVVDLLNTEDLRAE